MRPARANTVAAAVVALVLVVAAACTQARGGTERPAGAGTTGTTGPAPGEPQGIEKIDHVIIIIQENRSFDHYFGTYPGADGIPMKDGKPTPCIPNPYGPTCAHLYHATSQFQDGGQHDHKAAVKDIHGGKMDGFLEALGP